MYRSVCQSVDQSVHVPSRARVIGYKTGKNVNNTGRLKVISQGQFSPIELIADRLTGPGRFSALFLHIFTRNLTAGESITSVLPIR